MERTGVTRARSGCVSDGASVALSVPAFIPSDGPDSPAKDEAGAEGKRGEGSWIPATETPHGAPFEGPGEREQEQSPPGYPRRGCGVRGVCAVRFPFEQGTRRQSQQHPTLSCFPCAGLGCCLGSPSLENVSVSLAARLGGEHGLRLGSPANKPASQCCQDAGM